MNLNVFGNTSKNAQLEVSSEVFGQKPVASLLAQAVRIYLSNQRQGTSKVKTRADINRTKKKWYKQKGTGGARHGARTPSIFVGGAVAHGPTGLTDWSMKLSASQRIRAMIYALSSQVKNIVVSNDVMQLSGKTKEAAAFIEKIAGKDARVLIVLAEPIADVIRATANLEKVLVTQASRMNVYETLLAEKIIMTEQAVRALETRLIKADKAEKSEKLELKVEKTPKVVKVEKTEKIAPKAKIVAKAVKATKEIKVVKAAKTIKAKVAKPVAKETVKKIIKKTGSK